MIHSATLINSLLLRVAITAFITVLASLNSFWLNLCLIIASILLAIYCTYWILDDWLIEKLKISQGDYYARLIISGIAAIIGFGVGLWIIF